MMWGISSSCTPSVAGISPAVKPAVIFASGSLNRLRDVLVVHRRCGSVVQRFLGPVQPLPARSGQHASVDGVAGRAAVILHQREPDIRVRRPGQVQFRSLFGTAVRPRGRVGVLRQRDHDGCRRRGRVGYQIRAHVFAVRSDAVVEVAGLRKRVVGPQFPTLDCREQPDKGQSHHHRQRHPSQRMSRRITCCRTSGACRTG